MKTILPVLFSLLEVHLIVHPVLLQDETELSRANLLICGLEGTNWKHSKGRLHLQFLLRFSPSDACERVDEL
jgi:hypothetical protein